MQDIFSFKEAKTDSKATEYSLTSEKLTLAAREIFGEKLVLQATVVYEKTYALTPESARRMMEKHVDNIVTQLAQGTAIIENDCSFTILLSMAGGGHIVSLKAANGGLQLYKHFN